MIWNKDISFEGFQDKINEWYKDKDFELCDPPIDAQFALNLIFKTLVDDKENYEYLTTMTESTEQINSIKLDLILNKYSRKYRKFKKDIKNKRSKKMAEDNTKKVEELGEITDRASKLDELMNKASKAIVDDNDNIDEIKEEIDSIAKELGVMTFKEFEEHCKEAESKLSKEEKLVFMLLSSNFTASKKMQNSIVFLEDMLVELEQIFDEDNEHKVTKKDIATALNTLINEGFYLNGIKYTIDLKPTENKERVSEESLRTMLVE